jgi:hypothetical protein
MASLKAPDSYGVSDLIQILIDKKSNEPWVMYSP